VILWRVLPLHPPAGPTEHGGVLWFPRELQGAGRHDNPERYGCLYLALDPVAAVAEALAPFRGSGELTDGMLIRAGRRVALTSLELSDDATLVDLDDPAVLVSERLRPSQVATRTRGVTQAQALRLYEAQSGLLGLRWWSTLESSWINVTLFERAADRLAIDNVRTLFPEDAHVREAGDFLGLS
jgi:RES domain